MSVDSNREPPQERPHVERAEELLSRLGQRFAQSRTQFSQVLEQRAARTNGAGGQGEAPDTRPATERAEQMLDRAGERVGAFASNASYQVRRWLARAREEAEDILAEARSVNQRTESEVHSAGRDSVTGPTSGAVPASETAPKRAARPKTAAAAEATKPPTTTAVAKSSAPSIAASGKASAPERPRGTRKSAKTAEERSEDR